MDNFELLNDMVKGKYQSQNNVGPISSRNGEKMVQYLSADL